jgi:hypothetical protein
MKLNWLEISRVTRDFDLAFNILNATILPRRKGMMEARPIKNS